ncbi:hypothetical protein QBC34DRAFT_435447 [Podospora aff. communis PSN243]|uniref:RING-type domain-containing protein n=1 Tax=Podospora aff. communis PSN243 TaxID=3040156 RepID=A0AAV9GXW7_9PEZI|nr:hypothetical protein QBC34DRAFT_435447 [Podospora aff. communis PSN243]
MSETDNIWDDKQRLVAGAIFAFGCVVLAALYLWSRTTRQRRRRDDEEAAISEARRQRLATPAERPLQQRLDTQTLDTVAPEKTYRALKSEKIQLVPDQTGDRVDCSICLEDFDANSPVRCLPCHHIFHSECITKWLLRRHATCPLCMARYVPDSALPALPPRVAPYPTLRDALIAGGIDRELQDIPRGRARREDWSGNGVPTALVL